MAIQKTTDLSNHRLNILCYGASGVGKTHFAGSVQKRFKTLVLSAESGLLSLLNIVDEKGEPIPIDFEKIEKFEDIEVIYHKLRNRVKTATEDYSVYEAVAIDSLTDIQLACMEHILTKTGRDQMQQQDWGTLAQKIERMVRAFRDLPLHFVATALEEPETDKLTGEVKIWPMLKGSVQQKLPSYFDTVLYHYSKEMDNGHGEKEATPCALTKNTGKYQGKDRRGKLPQVIIKPDFGKVYDITFSQTKGE